MSGKIMIHDWAALKYKIEERRDRLSEEDLEEVVGNRRRSTEKLSNRGMLQEAESEED